MPVTSMSKKPRGTPWSDDERRFVREAYPGLGPAAIARKLGRSRSGVCALVARMKESGEISAAKSIPATAAMAGPRTAPAPDEDGRQDTLGRLRWVRSLLERQLYDAETTQAARLAKEYRETVEAIERMESAEGGGANDGLDALAGAIARKLG